jgi:hypothetical protein
MMTGAMLFLTRRAFVALSVQPKGVALKLMESRLGDFHLGFLEVEKSFA